MIALNNNVVPFETLRLAGIMDEDKNLSSFDIEPTTSKVPIQLQTRARPLSPSQITKLSIMANNDMSEDKPRCSIDDLFVVLYNVETNLKPQVIIPPPGTLDKLTSQLNSSDRQACNQPANIIEIAQSARH